MRTEWDLTRTRRRVEDQGTLMGGRGWRWKGKVEGEYVFVVSGTVFPLCVGGGFFLRAIPMLSSGSARGGGGGGECFCSRWYWNIL